MATDPEALAQISRLLGDDRLRHASIEAVEMAASTHFSRLVDGLLAEAAASDDVSDVDSGLAFIDDRLRFLAGLLSDDLRTRLRQALRARIEAW